MGTMQHMGPTGFHLPEHQPLEFPLTLAIPNGCGVYIARRIASTPGTERPDKAMADGLKERLLADPTNLVVVSKDELELMRRTTTWLGKRLMINKKKREDIQSISHAIRTLLMPKGLTFQTLLRYAYGWSDPQAIYKLYSTLYGSGFRGLRGKTADCIIMDEVLYTRKEEIK